MSLPTLTAIVSGMAPVGCWGIFDEFNRVLPEVLASFVSLLKGIYDGLRARKTTIMVEGFSVPLDSKVGIFTSFNPGYAGRSAIPESMKALFRPIAMIAVDTSMICEVLLMSQGFTQAKTLGPKVKETFALARDSFSKNDHYDFGMRALKSVFVTAGASLRKLGSDATPEVESLTVMQSIRGAMIPKLLSADQVILLALLGDMFPGLNPPSFVDEKLQSSIVKACANLGITADEVTVLKAVQLHKAMESRHCVMPVGPPGTGKRCVIGSLFASAQLALSFPSYTSAFPTRPPPTFPKHATLAPRGSSCERRERS